VFFWRLLSALLVLYIILISMRVMLTWLAGAAYGRAWRLLEEVTDPYLKLFRGLHFLRRGSFDFTPVAAIMALVVALNLVSAVLLRGRFTLGILLSALLGALWSGLSFLLLLFLILAVVRLLLLLFSPRRESPLAGLLESMARPVVSLVRGLLPFAWLARETHALIVVIIALLIVRLAGGWLLHLLQRLLEALPV
jgi:YggT family protein